MGDDSLADGPDVVLREAKVGVDADVGGEHTHEDAAVAAVVLQRHCVRRVLQLRAAMHITTPQ